ncbi:hypothetical protein AcV5_001777 [Taiwanofungus camphoratus]|nr:hypothetical protein AcV5_001777 [Antrodia cinnamomea]
MLPRSKLSKVRLTRRFASSEFHKSICKSNEGDASQASVLVNEEEETRVIARRMMKAERDERMDITTALTPVKTYMDGFTRPRDLRASNWFPGGAYAQRKKVYELPPRAAYEPHTVFLLESRYLVKYGIGRVDAHEHFVGVCREGDFSAVLQRLNSTRAPTEVREAMDNARWPWLPQKKLRRTVWWKKGENPDDVLRELLEGEEAQASTVTPAPGSSTGASYHSKQGPVARGNSLIVTEILDPSSNAGGSVSQRRAFHFSIPRSASRSKSDPAEQGSSVADAPGRDTSSSPASRSTIPTSSWDSPHRSTNQSAYPDDVVPPYYVERKRQRDDIEERKEEEGSLMAELNAGILSEGLSAQMRTREEKIPVEVVEEDGKVRHASGFEPPTAETDFHPVAAKPAEGPSKLPWTDVPHTKNSRTFHSSACTGARAISDEAFHMIAPALTDGLKVSPNVESTPRSQEMDEYDGNNDDDRDVNATSEQYVVDENLRTLRSQYLPTLGAEPFWRPLLSFTFSTRPLALSMARLSRGLERGLPFYASVTNEDRKCHASFTTRMRNLRLNRMHKLAMDCAHLLQGARGGLVGIRFRMEDKGRSIGGDGLADPIPLEKRLIKVGVGEWYPRSGEVKELFEVDARNAEISDAVEVFGLDEHGMRTDGVPWPPPPPALSQIHSVDQYAMLQNPAVNFQDVPVPERRRTRQAYAAEHKRDAALVLAQAHRGVLRP